MLVRRYVLWGVIGGLSFLVLLQGYELFSGFRTPLAVKVGVAAGVTGLATLLTAALGRWLRGKGSP